MSVSPPPEAMGSRQHTRERHCPVCGGTERQLWLRKADLTLVRCACSMVYAASSETSQPSYYQTTGDAFYSSDEKVRGDYSPTRYQREVALLGKFCAGGKLLDVGCSTGGFLARTIAEFPGRYQVYGSDIAANALKIAAAHNVWVIERNFLAEDFPEQQFDAVTFWAVLEHIPEPAAHIARARALLKPGGLIFVVVPNISSLAVRLLSGRYRYILPEHLNSFPVRPSAAFFKQGSPPFTVPPLTLTRS